MDTNKILDFIKSKKVVVFIAILFGIALLLGTFSIGVAVGYRKAKFSYAWGENYDRNFGGPSRGILGIPGMPMMYGQNFFGAHGVFGVVIKIDGTSLVIQGNDNIEKVVVVDRQTVINRSRQTLAVQDLRVNDRIIIIGEPDEQGRVIAKLIRVFPPTELTE